MVFVAEKEENGIVPLKTCCLYKPRYRDGRWRGQGLMSGYVTELMGAYPTILSWVQDRVALTLC